MLAWRRWGLVLGLVVSVGACAPEEVPDAGVQDPQLAEPAEEAVADLAATTGIASDDIEVVRAERVTWRDGALGCPRPGEMYTQALVEGYRILLQADGEEFAYHGATGQPPFFCEDPEPTAEEPTE
jgi:hypothetical protein